MGRVLRMDPGRPGGTTGPVVVQSLLRTGDNCWTRARAERVGVLVDAEAYFRAVHHAVLQARRSILIVAWDFNSRILLHQDPVPPGGPPAVLGDLLNYAVRRRPRLHVHVLNWDYPMVFGTDREFPPQLMGFGWSPARRVHLRYDDTHPLAGSQHQKVVVVDDVLAFAGGIDLTARHWDTREHRRDDSRRQHEGQPYPPYHDVMMAVDGEAARALGDLARERWRLATGERLRPPRAWDPGEPGPWLPNQPPDMERVEVGIARTLPPRGEFPGVREVERLYLDMIADARESIYLENQYFTSPRIAAALERRLAAPSGPEIAMVLRLLSHGWLEEHTMHVLRVRLIDRLLRADRHGRLKVYYAHVPGLPEGSCLDVHSKLMVVDDRILRIGSSNLSSRSLGVDSECDLVVEALGRSDVARAIRAARDGLLAEHLGCPRDAFSAKAAAVGLHAAIRAFRRPDGRALLELKDLPEWSDAVVELASVADPEEPIEQRLQTVAALGDEEPAADRPRWKAIAAIVAGFALLAGLWQFTALAEVVTAERAIRWARDFGDRPWAPAAVMLAYTPACFVMFPRPLLTLASVMAFGPWMGFLTALAGITFSAAATYVAGRRMKRDTVRRLAGAKLDRMVAVLKRHGLLAMTLLRLVPLAPFAVEGIVAGAVRLKLWHLLAGTAIGLTPGTLAATVFGSQIESALSRGEVNWWVIGAVVAALAAGGYAVQRWFSRMAKTLP